ncbi:peptide chain release factor 1 [Haliangium ochraceum]|uniref:Peptide chain release factor 1 n=1 Tax=Haliangium ochraceum (strain DSM 14365 / JCM 11303 / SMP-2) TaxID=502025 RepID=D0LRQ1_HALO1|nr:peptide chain release factor 1 [Haliangium ochraceum]ACY19043.1 peptide chain release factor 1 [Haliangium ochraceum DSM 14365]
MFDDQVFIDKMEALERRYQEVSDLLGQNEVISNRSEFTKLSREHAELAKLVAAWQEYRELRTQESEARAMVASESDAEMRELAREELRALQESLEVKEQHIKILLLPKDPNDGKNILLELRAGTGGDEAALFAGDLYRMYMRYAERQGWKTEIMSMSDGAAGGMKEAVVLIAGKDVYSSLKYESGVHRVQRVPATESQGRVHTSAATVVVMPEAEEVDIKLEEKDLRIDVYRSSGPGGQSVNTTDSAVRVTHLPTGIVVICQDEKSQHKNKAKAMRILRSRVLDVEIAKQEAEERDQRRSMVKSGDRSEKIRTYNFPQDRLTDHRINLTRHNLSSVLDGDLYDVVDALRAHYQTEALKQQAMA